VEAYAPATRPTRTSSRAAGRRAPREGWQRERPRAIRRIGTSVGDGWRESSRTELLAADAGAQFSGPQTVDLCYPPHGHATSIQADVPRGL